MKIEIEQYADSRKLVEKLIQRKGIDSYKDIASEFAVISAIPVFVVYFYIGEIIGFNDWIIERMKSLSKFYGYTEVIANTDMDVKQFTEREWVKPINIKQNLYLRLHTAIRLELYSKLDINLNEKMRSYLFENIELKLCTYLNYKLISQLMLDVKNQNLSKKELLWILLNQL